ncbi:hypothetical protein WV31_16725 [Magnetospirillum sp. ME-1]|uniref:class I SAM-dependent methyltransferase n=1 Tax=Magnetospirillum sp. ME-1 TaxID=1639348 RepID=UPI000A17D1AA|nr:class I SAM-dependent methyltransferase [Magnetospirillum sp. ME-1]ARJ67194.1 hypothetical protein WV31_16725 [Magnetospirillum sp. ME-1]
MSVFAAADPAPVACTVCGAPSPLMGVVDFHKSCLELDGKRLGLRGIPVYYRRCPRCGLVFCDTMLRWSDEDFARRIYNADYAVVDPEYAETRPVGNAALLLDLLGEGATGVSVMDYGGGNGRFAAELRAAGLRAATVDPHTPHPTPDFATADLVTAFEVFEHAMRPQRVLDEALALMEPDGALMFSTLLQPAEFDALGLGWWYVAPRNGHVSIHSRTSLSELLGSRGLRLVSFSDGLHLAFRQMPAFLRHRLKEAR